MKSTHMKLPNWVELRYNILWDEFEKSHFDMDDAVRVLEEKNKDKKKEVPVFLSEMRKAGWLNAEMHPDDARKTVYSLKPKQEIFEEILTIEKNKLTKGDVESLLKKAADLIRTRVDYQFILILLFLKRISDKWEDDFKKAYDEAIQDGFSEVEAKKEASNAAYHDFDLPEKYLWNNIRKDVANLPERLSHALKTIAEKNPELKDVLDNVDFIQFTTSRENSEILRQLIELFSERKLNTVSPDILGDAYEWILRYFAPQKAKEGEVYTPREVIKLLVEILDPKPGESVYDPCGASNGMLIISYEHVQEKYGRAEADKLFLYAQEANHKTLALGRMNLYIHDIKNAKIAYGDTLRYPKFKDKDGVQKFNMVIANPPWNQDGYGEETLKKGEFWKQRFSYGFVPNQSADWAWIQHMVNSTVDDYGGRVGIVIDNGCLFRGGKERTIRSRMIDIIDCVILLPEKLFYNTGAPGAIMILNKNKPAERKDKIIFINASEDFGQHPDVRKLNILDDEHIAKIVSAFMDFKDIPGFSKVVSVEDIDDYNLNVSLYVYPEKEIEEIDIHKEWNELKEINNEIQSIDEKLERYLEELK
jgi:type I restriction enzyme M protein